MAINFTTLTGAKTVSGSIASWINWGLIPSEDILTEAQAWIYDRLRCREMRSVATVDVALNASSVALPADYIAPITFSDALHFDGQGEPTPWVPADELNAQRIYDESNVLGDGYPQCWSDFDEAMQFDVRAQEALKGRLAYYKRPAALAATTNETNFLTIKYPTLLRRVCLAYAYEHRKNRAAYQDNIALAEKDIVDANRNAELA